MSGFISLTDKSSEEEEVKVVTKEEHEMDVAHSWMEVQGCLHTWYGLAFLTIFSLFYG